MSTGFKGTLPYMAIEFANSDGGLSHTKESDVWAFGMVTYVRGAALDSALSSHSVAGTLGSQTPLRWDE